MNRNEIRLFDDSVIKLTIKQGQENERFVVQENENSWTYNGAEIDIRDWNAIYTLPGSLSSGELAYTRDTSRLFVGNIYDSKTDASGHQQTIGGVLVGNKYLGYVDSRNKNIAEFSGENGTKLSGTPLKLSGKGGLLEDGSDYRSYNWPENSDDGKTNTTEDGKWQKIPYYNAKYDAYDGDYMYDIYRNAFILFDHNIKQFNGEIEEAGKLSGKRKTPLIPRYKSINEDERTEEEKVSYSYTSDMYGDGYVLFYNVIPDGRTLTFETKTYGTDGIAKNDVDPNYSYNILKINKLDVSNLNDVLNLETDEEGASDFVADGNIIKINQTIKNSIEKAAARISPIFSGLYSENSSSPAINPSDNCFLMGINPYTGSDDKPINDKIEESSAVQTEILVSELSSALTILNSAFNKETGTLITDAVLPDYISKVEVEELIDKKMPSIIPGNTSNTIFPRLKESSIICNPETLFDRFENALDDNGEKTPEIQAESIINSILFNELRELIFANTSPDTSIDTLYIRTEPSDIPFIIGNDWDSLYKNFKFNEDNPDNTTTLTTIGEYINRLMADETEKPEINYYLYIKGEGVISIKPFIYKKIKTNHKPDGSYDIKIIKEYEETITLSSNGTHISIPLENDSNYDIEGVDINSIYYMPVRSKNGAINEDIEVGEPENTLPDENGNE